MARTHPSFSVGYDRELERARIISSSGSFKRCATQNNSKARRMRRTICASLLRRNRSVTPRRCSCDKRGAATLIGRAAPKDLICQCRGSRRKDECPSWTTSCRNDRITTVGGLAVYANVLADRSVREGTDRAEGHVAETGNASFAGSSQTWNWQSAERDDSKSGSKENSRYHG